MKQPGERRRGFFPKRLTVLNFCFAAAFVIILYPIFANLYNGCVMRCVTAEYRENLSGLTQEDLREEYERAVAYNSSLTAANDAFADMTREEAYESCLNTAGNGIMGTISIPKINVDLPIYHYTTSDVLRSGVGHLETTALPVGGSGTRCVLTGHRGLPGSKLFTCLDELEIGDVFYLYVLNETLAYEVAEIEVVDPEDAESVAARSGEDLCTLVTCTPYGVNSHRLLVTGTRTEYTEEEAGEEAESPVAGQRDYILICTACAELLFYLFLRRKIQRNH